MASVKAQDVPEEQQMWIDIWNFRKKYYYPEKENAYWKMLTQEVRVLGEKYKTKLCRKILFAILDDIKDRWRESNGTVSTSDRR